MIKHKMTINKDQGGEFKRVVLLLRPLQNEKLVKIQKDLKDKIPELQLYGQEKLHLTLFHFGKPKSLYKDFKKYNDNLDYNTFLTDLQELMEKILSKLKNNELVLTSENLKIFQTKPGGRDKSNYVLTFSKNAKLNSLQQSFLELIFEWVAKQGITESEVEQLFTSSSNLKSNLPKTYMPHVTLGNIFGSKNAELKRVKYKETISFCNLQFLNTEVK